MKRILDWLFGGAQSQRVYPHPEAQVVDEGAYSGYPCVMISTPRGTMTLTFEEAEAVWAALGRELRRVKDKDIGI